MKTAEAVVFDFNGTLFFDYNENRDAWNEISLKYRGRLFTGEEYDSMMGMTDLLCAEKIVGKKDISYLEKVGEEKEEIYLRLCKERGLTIEKDAVTFIKQLKKDGIKVLIASSAPKANMEWYIANLGLMSLFPPKYIIAGRYDLPSKPAPDIFRLALATAGVKEDDAICFEDAPNGLRAALATPFKKVYAINSPGFNNTVQKTLAPMIDWSYTLSNYREVISL